ncbi:MULTISPECIES: hypothetical protein [Pseudomonas aeruginosa group]|uniref:hypothetical protein n=1 Tax=Pseudomonas aeruginosa group TaxID=136841 RepID=UPI00086AAA3E|nr:MULTISPECIES: hypothetical protein [Pseudomonas aeruginosa group]MBG3907060.1 hypothetical protein [Pseudomonas aeruginosa]MBG4203893.1 hypothetical protein [Pseudomonas aeruginosa]MBG4282117.1 hypothetical protein [Pseudomonas aeruginosa]MBG6893519.1 hypothetical protein [Pseudomonas aeruginosa]MBM9935422.1 hypothetical protein [Pseudomonas aeruginosa]
MAELQRASVTGGGLYERLLQRLALALDEADTAERLRDERPTELELRGLSEAEMGLIRAYLDQDLHWLRGWHAAAEELALLERQPGRTARPPRPQTTPMRRHVSLKQRQLLCALCALCGAPVQWSKGHGVLPCGHCGSQLFRSGNGR